MDNDEENIMPEKSGKHRSGRARMDGLSDAERSALGKSGAKARWAKPSMAVPRAICGSDESPLVIGGVVIPCYVLEDERRVITLDGMRAALEIHKHGSQPRFDEFLAAIEPNSATANELAVKLHAPFVFKTTTDARKSYKGYEASLLVDVCESLLDARRAGTLPDRLANLGMRAELLVRGFARVGIDALIDEATGFQKFRSKNALLELLQKYISDKLLQWAKTFPDEFYTEMFRLKGWDYINLRAGDRKPSVVGRYTRNIVYERMDVPVIEQLEKLNPSISPGVRGHKHHQFLTREIGHPELKSHIEKVTMLMKLSENWEDFRGKLRKVMPKKWEQFQFADLLPDPPDAPPTYSDDGLD
ncbi:MAG TPA: P63C domain-containing protein [Tepidisphaeraceae bacterium]|jgi:hypothetical protein